MKTKLLLCLCAIAFSYHVVICGSNALKANADSIRKVDEYGDISFTEEKRRLAALAAELRTEADYVGYIIVYAGRRSCRHQADLRAARAKNFLVRKLKFPTDRIITIDGGYREELAVELYAFPHTAPAPYASPTVHHSEVEITGECEPKKL